MDTYVYVYLSYLIYIYGKVIKYINICLSFHYLILLLKKHINMNIFFKFIMSINLFYENFPNVYRQTHALYIQIYRLHLYTIDMYIYTVLAR